MTIAVPPVTEYVLDACSMIAFLDREPGAEVVDGLLLDANKICYAHAVNACEVYYDVQRNQSADDARQAIAKLQGAGVDLRDDMDTTFWQQVGDLKINPGKLSLADCFALALVLRLGATLVTSDHHEFDRIAAMGLCPILFIR